jgi:hypothetical protein
MFSLFGDELDEGEFARAINRDISVKLAFSGPDLGDQYGK